MSDHNADAAMPAPLSPAPAPAVPAEPVRAKPGTDWWAEVKGVLWLLLGVLAVWSFVAKPFYIPSESMMPNLLTGDRLIVTKYPYGWSWVSLSFHILPPFNGRLFGRLPERGDIVIVTPPGQSSDYIKRVIALPGDTVEMRAGALILNGVAVRRETMPPAMIPIDPNTPCSSVYQAGRDVPGPGGRRYCQLPVVRETLPNGRTYDTIDFGYMPGGPDDYGPIVVPPDHVFLMGDNRDESADSRVALSGAGLGGPVPFENIGGRAEFITFSFDGSTRYWNPLTWFSALRPGRAGTSLHPARVPLK